MHLIVGLGNPGEQYAAHRHNVGAMAIDAIATEYNFPPFRSKFKGLFSDGKIGSQRVMLLKPQTFMNNSGEAVYAALKFYKIQPEDVTVIYDELDLNPGKIRVKSGGGNNGHNGLRSIDPQIGVDYQRVRVGIGHPGQKQLVNSHVLSNFHKVDHLWLDPVLAAIAKNAHLLVKKEQPAFMNKLALAVQKADDDVSEGKVPRKKKAGAKTNTKTDPASTGKSSTTEKNSNNNQTAEPSSQLAGLLKKLFNKE
ncbi:Peptidyl-tRNA hydrolase [hydrothermal vent metagenome]|uniref:peptidyl-tRNA hydrolase n=1 Tax=hydrothermal vent metagenome TaxID=652676 RepID=A0A3B0TZN7_9ZZZZ